MKCVSEQKYKRKVESNHQETLERKRDTTITRSKLRYRLTDQQWVVMYWNWFWSFILAGTSFRSSGDEVN